MFEAAMARYAAFRSGTAKVSARRAMSRKEGRRVIRQKRRGWSIERLEPRLAMSAEGTAVSIEQFVDASGLAGPLTAEAIWGDGSRGPIAASPIAASNAVRFQFDYSLDTAGFFNAQPRRDALESAGRALAASLTDSLAAIAPSGSNTWTPKIYHPATGALVNAPLTSVPAGVLYVYAGGRDLPSGQLAEAGPGNNSASGTPEWLNIALGRGQPNARGQAATDFGPWGGAVAFDTLVNWYDGTAEESIGAGQTDLFSVAAHELMHVLGFGTSNSWNRLVSGGSFVGEASRAANGGVNPTLADASHWSSSITASGRETLMRPDAASGRRRLATRLDLAGLDDVGWDVSPTSTRTGGVHVYGDNGVYPVRLIVRGSTPGSVRIDLPALAVTNVPPSVVAGGVFNIIAGQPLIVGELAVFTDPGFGASETFRGELDWGDSLPLTSVAATILQSGSAGAATRGIVGGSHVYTVPGVYRGTATVFDDDGGAGAAAFTVNVLLPPQLSLEISADSFAENAGVGAAMLTVQALNYPAGQPVVVSLASSDPSEASVPASIVIPAGQTRVQVPVDAVDDALLDGTASVRITAIAGGAALVSITVLVTDYETIRIDLSRSTVREDAGAGAAVMRLTRPDGDVSVPLLVSLASSDLSSVRLPATAVISAGSTFVDVGLEVVDDTSVSGDRDVRLTASAEGYVGGEGVLRVVDFEPLSIAASAFSIAEGDPVGSSISLTVTSPHADGMRVFLAADSADDVVLPQFIDIPPGSRSAVVRVTMIDDRRVEPAETIVVTASAPGYTSASVSLAAIDNDLGLFTNLADPFNVNGDEVVSPLDLLSVINAINIYRPGSVNRLDPEAVSYVDVNADGQLTPLDLLALINFLNSRRRV